MRLEVVTPGGLTTFEDVAYVALQTPAGAFGVRQRRLDFVAPLAPGILAYRTTQGAERFLATDEGVVVKAGEVVRIAVRRAAGDVPLAELRETVAREFLVLDEEERRLREALARVESRFFRTMKELSAHARP
jgi:F-type H+-transporting ATPase subunit epsilon